MKHYRIIPADRFEELMDIVDQAAELLEQAGELQLPEGRAEEAEDTGDGGEDSEKEMEYGWRGERAQYEISQAGWQYADVVVEEMSDDVFSLDQVWKKVGPLIATKSSRARDGIRTALDRDERFERTHGDREGVWWRRVETNED